MRNAALVLLAALALTACGSSASQPPAHSAPAACRSFASWFLDQGSNILAGKDPALLAQAVKEAPSGGLYRDLSTLRSNVITAEGMQGTALATGTKALTVSSAYQVEQDCQSVNPS